MDKKQALVSETFTREQLLKMDPDQLAALLGKAARPDVQFLGKGVVRRKDGTIKYDYPERAGQYGEDD